MYNTVTVVAAVAVMAVVAVVAAVVAAVAVCQCTIVYDSVRSSSSSNLRYEIVTY